MKSEGNTDPNLSKDLHCNGGPLKISYYKRDNYTDFILNGIKERGFPQITDINAPHGPGVCVVQGTVYDGRRQAACKAFVNPIQHRRNLKIVKCAVVTRVLFKGNRAIGVEFYYNGKPYRAYANKEVILCAGAIGTPIILQLSGIGLQEDLNYNGIQSWLKLPVGRNLQDHFAAWIWFSLSGDATSAGQLFSSIVGYYNCPRTGDFTGIGTLSVIWFFNTPSNSRPHIECYFFLFTKQSLNLPVILALLAYEPAIVQNLIEINQEKIVVLIIPSQLDPKSRGIVRINGVKGPEALSFPYILANYLSHPYDKTVLSQAIEIVVSLHKSPSWEAVGAEFIRLPLPDCEQFTDINTEQYRQCYLGYMGATVYHYSCTARMGRTPRKNEQPNSVVNPKCQVHFTVGLSVADASM